MIKQRSDLALVNRGLVKTRTRAQALIKAGLVISGNQPIRRANEVINDDMPLTVKGQDYPWVSRGGMKLAYAFEVFGLNAKQYTAIDLGASTGGFTDVLLQKGAAKVYAIDVGYGQISPKIRHDERVITLEKCNARYLDKKIIPFPIDCIVCDVSFIGLQTVLPASLQLCRQGAWTVALIKPQFEAGKQHVGKKGIVRDPIIHNRICKDIDKWWSMLSGWKVKNIIPSPILGSKGNREFLIHAQLS